MHRRRLWILGLLATLALSSCSYFRQMLGWVAEKPEVRLIDLEIQSFSVRKIEMVFVLDIRNPNAFQLEIERLDYRVQGLGFELGRGEYKGLLSLEAKEHSTVRLPFVTEPEVALRMMKSYIKNPQNLKLRLAGSMHIGTAFGSMDMHFDEEKTMIKGFSQH